MKKWTRELENSGRENNVELVDLVQSFPTMLWLQKIGFDIAENEPPKVC